MRNQSINQKRGDERVLPKTTIYQKTSPNIIISYRPKNIKDLSLSNLNNKEKKITDFSNFYTNPSLRKKNYVLLEIVHKNEKKKREIQETENKLSNEPRKNHYFKKKPKNYEIEKIVNLKSNHRFLVSSNIFPHTRKMKAIDTNIKEKRNHVLKETKQMYKYLKKNNDEIDKKNYKSLIINQSKEKSENKCKSQRENHILVSSKKKEKIEENEIQAKKINTKENYSFKSINFSKPKINEIEKKNEAEKKNEIEKKYETEKRNGTEKKYKTEKTFETEKKKDYSPTYYSSNNYNKKYSTKGGRELELIISEYEKEKEQEKKEYNEKHKIFPLDLISQRKNIGQNKNIFTLYENRNKLRGNNEIKNQKKISPNKENDKKSYNYGELQIITNDHMMCGMNSLIKENYNKSLNESVPVSNENKNSIVEKKDNTNNSNNIENHLPDKNNIKRIEIKNINKKYKKRYRAKIRSEQKITNNPNYSNNISQNNCPIIQAKNERIIDINNINTTNSISTIVRDSPKMTDRNINLQSSVDKNFSNISTHFIPKIEQTDSTKNINVKEDDVKNLRIITTASSSKPITTRSLIKNCPTLNLEKQVNKINEGEDMTLAKSYSTVGQSTYERPSRCNKSFPNHTHHDITFSNLSKNETRNNEFFKKNDIDLQEVKIKDFDCGRYTGILINDKREKIGIMEYTNGSRYEGEWKNDQKNGKGIFISSNYNRGRRITGLRYEGDFKNDKIAGWGVGIYTNGDKYEGEWFENKQYGRGVVRYRTGGVYDGEWKRGRFNGFGIYYLRNGEKYEGKFVNSKYHGYGKYTHINGEVLEGVFNNDHPTGNCILHKPDGTTERRNFAGYL